MNNDKQEKSSFTQNFVTFIIKMINQDKGAKAKLRRADNPDTEYQSWEYLVAFNSLPHERGGVSHALRSLIDDDWSSPRAWGCF